MKIELGQFEVVSGKVRLTDPCYDTDVWCSGEVKNVRKGSWNSYVEKSEKGGWGNRCEVLVAYTGKTRKIDDRNWISVPFEVGVDSGQAGIFDSKFYFGGTDDEIWYQLCCKETLGEVGAGVIPNGVVSSSGYGDGGYEGFIIKDKDEVVAIKIVFIGEEEDEDEENDEDEDND